MVIQYFYGGIIKGLKSDREGYTVTDLPVGTLWIETDTENIYDWDGAAWRQKGGKPLESALSGSFTIYIAGTTVKARNNTTGLVAYSGDNTVDAVPTINNTINNIPGAAASGWGGRISIARGDYKCITELAADIATTTYHGIELEGEGKGTRLNFTPASALTNAIRLKISRPRLAHMRIYGNSNVTNLIRALGPGGGQRHDYGILEGLQIDGANATTDAAATPIAGQKGIFMDGTNTALFFWKIHNCDFRGLDIGAHLYNIYSTSTAQTNNTFVTCDTAEKISGGQHNISNFWVQGTGAGDTPANVGRYGIWFTTEGIGTNNGSIQNITNVHGELRKANTECAMVLIDTGIASVRTANIINANSDSQYWFSVLDKTGNVLANLDSERAYFRRPSRSKLRTGWVAPGVMALGKEYGTLAGNIAESIGFSTANSANGPIKVMNTTATANTIRSMYFNTPTGNHYNRTANTRLTVRFYPLAATSERIFIGIWDQFVAPISTSDMLNAPRKGVGLWVDSGASAGNWKVMHNDGVGVSTQDDLSTVTAINTADLQIAEIITDHAESKYTVKYNNIATTVNTDIPDNVTLGWLISIENTLEGANRQLWIYDIEMETVK